MACLLREVHLSRAMCELLIKPLRRMRIRLEEMDEAIRDMKTQLAQLYLKLGLDFSKGVITNDKSQRQEVQMKIHNRTVGLWLPKTLANLLRGLLASSGAWLTADELAKRLGDKGTSRNPRAVAQSIFRLRKELRRAGLPWIIEGSRSHGYRCKSYDEA
jgi:DNA-binding response OmpR family regulator